MKISIALTGRIVSDSWKQKIRGTMRGKMSGSKHWNWNRDRLEIAARRAARNIIRRVLRHTLFYACRAKVGKTEEILGYSSTELRRHLESLFVDGMSWSNHGFGKGKWHVDHIIPVSAWPLDTLPSVVNALCNLRPLWQEDNLRKGKKLLEQMTGVNA